MFEYLVKQTHRQANTLKTKIEKISGNTWRKIKNGQPDDTGLNSHPSQYLLLYYSIYKTKNIHTFHIKRT